MLVCESEEEGFSAQLKLKRPPQNIRTVHIVELASFAGIFTI
jgi:hypothetical protein